MTAPRREIVEAGAGCGKTYGLVARYVEGLGLDPETGEVRPGLAGRPSQILALTFTEEAAREMRRRVLKRLNGWGHEELAASVLAEGRIHTFHGFCYRLLRPQLTKLGYSSQLFPPALATEARVRHTLGQLSRSEKASQLLELLGLSNLARLAPSLWFTESAENSQFESALRSDTEAAQAFQAKFLAATESAVAARPDLQAKPEGWLLPFRASLAQPLDGLEATIVFNRGPRDLAKQFPELAAAAKAWREFLKKKGPLHLEHVERELEAHRLCAEFFAELRASGPKLLDFSALEAELLAWMRSSTDSALLTPPRLLLVDEFQDTNRAQYEILRGLSGPETEWYFVGDPKQSIYAFRGTETSLFGELTLELTPKGLDRNYRSSSALLEFMNRLQEELFSPLRPQDPPAQFLHCGLEGRDREALLPGADPRPENAPIQIVEAADKEPFVEELLADFASRRAELGPDSTHAALFTSWKTLYLYAEECEARGVPCLIAGTEPFGDHALTEIFGRYLETLEDPTSLAGQAAILRWADPEFRIRTDVEASPAASLFAPELASAPWPELLRRFCAVLRPSRWERGAEWAAALERFVASVAETELAWTLSLAEFGRFLRRQGPRLELTVPLRRPADPGASVLRLYTVHGSKGLEFDAVYLPEFIERAHVVRDDSLDDEGGRAFRLRWKPTPGSEAMPGLGFLRSARREACAQEAEKRRLFYVAVTRAKRTLNLYFHTPAESKKGDEPDAFSDVLGWPRLDRLPWNQLLTRLRRRGRLEDLETRGYVTWDVREAVEEMADESLSTLEATAPAATPTSESGSDHSLPAPEPESEATEHWKFPQPLAPTPPHGNPFFRGGVSEYLNRNKVVDRSFFRQPQNEDHPTQLSPSERGTRLHAILEVWNGDVDTLDTLLESEVDTHALREAALAVRNLPELETFWAAIVAEDPQLRREFGLYVTSPEYRLSGFADALWLRDEEILILDWKTSGRLSTLERAPRLANIRRQLELYAHPFAALGKRLRGVAVGIAWETRGAHADIVLDADLNRRTELTAASRRGSTDFPYPARE